MPDTHHTDVKALEDTEAQCNQEYSSNDAAKLVATKPTTPP
jgi:hypothetical protein